MLQREYRKKKEGKKTYIKKNKRNSNATLFLADSFGPILLVCHTIGAALNAAVPMKASWALTIFNLTLKGTHIRATIAANVQVRKRARLAYIDTRMIYVVSKNAARCACLTIERK